jgi:hypothetical protein
LLVHFIEMGGSTWLRPNGGDRHDSSSDDGWRTAAGGRGRCLGSQDPGALRSSRVCGACGVLRNSLLFGVGMSRDTKSWPTAAHSRVPTHEQKHEATGVRDGTIAGGGRQSMSARQETAALSRHSESTVFRNQIVGSKTGSEEESSDESTSQGQRRTSPRCECRRPTGVPRGLPQTSSRRSAAERRVTVSGHPRRPSGRHGFPRVAALANADVSTGPRVKTTSSRKPDWGLWLASVLVGRVVLQKPAGGVGCRRRSHLGGELIGILARDPGGRPRRLG